VFVFSKLVWIFGQPLSLAFLFVLLAFIAVLLRWRATAIVSSLLSVLILFVSLYTTAGAYVVQGLEERFPHPAADPADLKCMIVLGGATQNEVTTARGGYELDSAGDRLIEALRLAQRYPQARIVISGGDGSIGGTYEGDAVISERFFTALGIPTSRMVEDKTSRTTFENAVNTKELLAQNGLSDCLLITSASICRARWASSASRAFPSCRGRSIIAAPARKGSASISPSPRAMRSCWRRACANGSASSAIIS